MNLNTIKYVKEFDAIRALAVVLVLISHWVPKETKLFLPYGSIGVDVFFVLSGFLITWILLLEKERKEEINQFKSIVNFVSRRGLRIFPIYYLLLILLFFGSRFLPNPIPHDFKFYAFYLQNYLFYFNQSFPGGKVSHLWTLAVEEQFYLFWPFIIIFISKRHLLKVLITGVFLGSLSSILFSVFAEKKELTDILTINCIQAFCLGGMASYMLLYHKNYVNENYPPLRRIALLAIALYLFLNIYLNDYLFFNRFLISIFISWVFVGIILEKFKTVNWLLNNRYLIAVGKISYGIYLYHNFIPTSVKAVFIYLIDDMTLNSQIILIRSLNETWNLIVFNLICLSILLMVSYASFFLIERPLLKLKVYFK